jgi:thiol-disulfide isomerase/thioredoxin
MLLQSAAFAFDASLRRISTYSTQSSLLIQYSSNSDPEAASFVDGLEDASSDMFLDSSASSPSKAQFGDVVRLGSKPNSNAAKSPKFGDVVHLDSSSKLDSLPDTSPTLVEDCISSSPSEYESKLQTRRKNNIIVAVLSITLAFLNYFWQFTHPVSNIQLLAQMQDKSDSITTLGKNGKPTVVDFWAPWCENCKQMAPTVYQIEQDFSGKVNFVMINGDDPSAWPLIEVFGVDAIPHMALVEADGTVDTALIGSVPKSWLERDLQVLVENSKTGQPKDKPFAGKSSLPYQMLDTFANRPEERRIQIIQKQ